MPLYYVCICKKIHVFPSVLDDIGWASGMTSSQ